MKAYIHGQSEGSSFWSRKVPVKISPLPWQLLGLTETATGYGAKLTTRYMVEFNGRWRRVYCAQFSNVGTIYIGHLKDNLKVSIHETSST